jgi:arsenate reductase
MIRVLFACVHNAGRSQMAAAFFNAQVNRARARGLSAGTEPASRVHPEVVVVMREVGVDLEHAAPQRLTDEVARAADILVTMGCGETCPVVPNAKRVDWEIEDPKGKDLDQVRSIRDGITDEVVRLIREEGLG